MEENTAEVDDLANKYACREMFGVGYDGPVPRVVSDRPDAVSRCSGLTSIDLTEPDLADLFSG